MKTRGEPEQSRLIGPTAADTGATQPPQDVRNQIRRLVAGRQQAPRRRSWGLIVLASVMVLGTGTAVAAWGLNAGQKVHVLALGRPVAKGHVIVRDDLVSVSVAGLRGAIPVAQAGTVVGQTADVDLVQGQVLTRRMITSVSVPSAGHAAVGLALDSGSVPTSGLAAGDVVDVIGVAMDDSGDTRTLDTPEVLEAAAQVYSVDRKGVDGVVLVTLVVDEVDAARIAAYSTQDSVAVVESSAVRSGQAGS
jgi:hypothetical protein